MLFDKEFASSTLHITVFIRIIRQAQLVRQLQIRRQDRINCFFCVTFHLLSTDFLYLQMHRSPYPYPHLHFSAKAATAVCVSLYRGRSSQQFKYGLSPAKPSNPHCLTQHVVVNHLFPGGGMHVDLGEELSLLPRINRRLIRQHVIH